MFALVLACSLPPIPDPSDYADHVEAPAPTPRPNTGSSNYDVDVYPRELQASYFGALDCETDSEAAFDAPLGMVTVVAYDQEPVHLSILSTFEDTATEDPSASWLDASVGDDVDWTLQSGTPLDVPIHAIGGCGADDLVLGDHRFQLEFVVGTMPYVTSYLIDATITLE